MSVLQQNNGENQEICYDPNSSFIPMTRIK